MRSALAGCNVRLHNRGDVTFRSSPERRALRAIYDEVDALLAPFGCAETAECCAFSKTGREPYPTAIELAEIALAISERGGARALLRKPQKRHLPSLVDASCPLLSQDGRCRIYASRPFGCRTHFCDRRSGADPWPRVAVLELGARVAELSARAFPRDPRPRPLRNALAKLT